MERNISDLTTGRSLGASSAKANWFRVSSLITKCKFTSPGQHGEALHSYFTYQCPYLILPLSKQQKKFHSSVADLLIWDQIILWMHPQFLPMVDSEFYFYFSQE